MKLKPIASNMTELYTPNFVVLFSYETPVACYHNGNYYRTTKKWSSTTTRHINKWLANSAIVTLNGVIENPQEWFDALFDNDYVYKGAL